MYITVSGQFWTSDVEADKTARGPKGKIEEILL
jgi:hypothetical protein